MYTSEGNEIERSHSTENSQKNEGFEAIRNIEVLIAL